MLAPSARIAFGISIIFIPSLSIHLDSLSVIDYGSPCRKEPTNKGESVMEDFIVFDARTGNITGPFTKGDAERMASQLNKMVFQNTLGGIIPEPAEIKGPFYSHPESKRAMLKQMW